MRSSFRVVYAVVAVFCLGLLAGCPEPDNRPATTPVTVTVTYKGEPVEKAAVVFYPATGNATGASGSTDSSGKAKLRAFPEKDGALPGQYLVAVSKLVEDRKPEDGDKDVPIISVLPKRYSDMTKSGFKAEVKAGEPLEMTCELVD